MHALRSEERPVGSPDATGAPLNGSSRRQRNAVPGCTLNPRNRITGLAFVWAGPFLMIDQNELLAHPGIAVDRGGLRGAVCGYDGIRPAGRKSPERS